MFKRRLVTILLLVLVAMIVLPSAALAEGGGENPPPPPPPPSPEPPFYGCTPGFWKNHTELWWYHTEINDLPFDFPPSLAELAADQMIESLSYKGGSGLVAKARILLRAAVAAKANIIEGLNYPILYGTLTSWVNAALYSENENTILVLAKQLDEWNNLGCPF